MKKGVVECDSVGLWMLSGEDSGGMMHMRTGGLRVEVRGLRWRVDMRERMVWRVGRMGVRAKAMLGRKFDKDMFGILVGYLDRQSVLVVMRWGDWPYTTGTLLMVIEGF